MGIDLEKISDVAATAAAKELDEHLPDGFIQAGSGEALELVGKIITKIGQRLSGEENKDGDA